MAKQKPFHNPFAGLKLKADEPAKKPPPAPAKPKPPPAPARDEPDDETLFLQAVGEVKPVKAGAPLVAPPAPSPATLRKIVDDEEEALTVLSELVAGEGPFDLVDSDEYIEGSVPGLDRKIVKKLRQGDHAVQAHLDLHGLVRAEAKAEVRKFIEASRKKGHRCVLIVHGRGLHSKDQIPVLKESLQVWLSRGAVGKQVLAFTTARPHDGGAGAVYVLLRR